MIKKYSNKQIKQIKKKKINNLITNNNKNYIFFFAQNSLNICKTASLIANISCCVVFE